MRAVQVHEPGGPQVLQVTEVADPRPGPGQALVAVEAAGVNFIDTYQRSGAYPLDLPATLGREAVGTVTDVADDVTHVRVGDRVGVLDQLGCYAEHVAVDASRAVPVPADLDVDVACALLLQGTTAHYLTTSTAPLGSDDTVLVYAASGGVGRLLVQLAVRRGARVLAATSSQTKADDARALGADAVIRYRDGDQVIDVAAAVAELTGGRGVDVVYDSVGATTFDHSLRSLRPRGLLALFGQSSGPVPPLDLQELNRHGSLYVTRPSLDAYVADRAELTARTDELFTRAAAGDLDVRIGGRHPLDDAATAHADLEAGATSGKLLLHP